MDYGLFLALISFTAMGGLTPGPNNLILMSQGTRFGFMRCIPYIFGVQFGFGLLLLSAALGLGFVVEKFPLSLVIVSALGALWLAWLAWGFAKAAMSPRGKEQSKTVKTHAKPLGFIEATLFQWVNPKGLIFAFGATAGWVGISDNIWLRTSIIIGTFLVMGFIGNIAWAAMGGAINRQLQGGNAGRSLNAIMAATIFATAIYVLYIGVKSLA